MADIDIERLRKMSVAEIAAGSAKENLYNNPPPAISEAKPFPQIGNVWLANEGYTLSCIPQFNRSAPPTTSTTTTTTTIP